MNYIWRALTQNTSPLVSSLFKLKWSDDYNIHSVRVSSSLPNWNPSVILYKICWFCCCCSVTELCPTLYNPKECSRPGFLVLTLSLSLLRLMSIESVIPSNHLILCHLPSYHQFFPASESFPVSQLFTSNDQSIEASASASVLRMNIQDWFHLALTCLISLQSKGLSKVFSNTTLRKHQFFGAQPSLWYNSHTHTWLLGKP